MKFNPSSPTPGPLQRSAFTLVETLAGLAIFGIGLAALCAGITYAMAMTKATRENARATQVMLESFEILRLYTWEELNEPGFVKHNIHSSYDIDVNRENGNVNYDDTSAAATNSIIYNGTVDIADASTVLTGTTYASDIRMVTITLNWVSAGVPRTRVGYTLVANRGLQNYVSLYPK